VPGTFGTSLVDALAILGHLLGALLSQAFGRRRWSLRRGCCRVLLLPGHAAEEILGVFAPGRWLSRHSVQKEILGVFATENLPASGLIHVATLPIEAAPVHADFH
jgi:hypothetical protein